MIFTMQIDPNENVAVRIIGDVMQTAVMFSKAFPYQKLEVCAINRVRMVLQNGAVIENRPEIGQWTAEELATLPVEWEAPVMTQWSTLNSAPLYRPMTLLERFRLAKAEDALDYKDNTTESDVVGYGKVIYGEYLDSLNIRKYIEI